ncbi:MAG TPA: FAD-binding and (Fe-S)-binding domain-containing protein [Terracidiphilus sp.]|nr:FAD-binding and (Fe-S)-binding domain-containing protein [Terracidiphilus sp.]
MSILPISQLLNQAPLDHERFSAHRELEAQLRATLRGEVLFDLGSRALYAADSSNYRQMPVGVVTPRDAADVEAALAACRATGAAVLPRGAGTSLAGQCANVAVVFDYSRHMNGLTSIDPEAKLAAVEPGIVLDRLREAAEVYHLTYAPDPATHSRCTLGGMIGNNSCGVHGLLGGKVVDNVETMDIVLYDGTRMTVGRTSEEEIEALIRGGGRVGEIYARLKSLRDRYADLIRAKFPRIPRRVSGFNLDELLPENEFNLARALVGSEGTCATVLSATLNLTSSPPYRVLTALAFDDPYLAGDAVTRVLEFGPIGLEGFDGLLVDFMLRKNLAVDDVKLLPPGGGFLLVEMGAWTPEEAQNKAEALARAAEGWPEAPRARIYNHEDAESVWKVRESALGATVCVPGEPDRWEGWDDAGIPPAHLGTYLRDLNALMNEYGYRSPLYGHYGQGCVHLRINFDFRTTEGLRKFREFIDRAADLVVSLGGSLSGEHGDGQARAVLLPKMFGPELMQGFQEFKAIWDPDNKMNPGKLTDAVRVYDPVENLRYGPRAEVHAQSKLETHFVFAADDGSLEHAAARCVGVGACLKKEGGVMCPSYRATGLEQHSTRGRARLLWEMLAGALKEEGFQSEAVHEALDLCLSCKACATECPVQVDMTRYKSEFLAQKYKGKLHPLHHYVFGFADKMARLGSLTPAITNLVLSSPITSPLIKHIVGVAKERQMPQLAPRSWKAARGRDETSNVPRGARAEGQIVVLWADTWNNYYHPQTLAAAERVLMQAGFRVQTTNGHICCGRALYDFGLLDTAKGYMAKVLDAIAPQIEAGLPFIFLEPSCASIFKDEALELFPNDERAQKMSRQVWLLADWLAAKAPAWVDGRLEGAQVLLHGHCHHKAVFGGPKNEIALLRKAGAQVEMINATCCGMAGPFGFEADKIEVSKAIANLGLLPAVNAAGPMTLIVADGFSCREQISQLSEREGMHFAEVLDRSCGCGG